MCKFGKKWRRKQETPKHWFEASRVVINANFDLMDPTAVLLYLGRIVAYIISNRLALYNNIKKYWRRRGMVAKALKNEEQKCGHG